MRDLITIKLNQLRFFAYHGFYEEEQKLGTEFEINVAVTRAIKPGIINSLSQTLNYATLYELIGLEMKNPRILLETLAMEIVEQIHHSFEEVKRVEIEITKLHLPIERFSGTASVKFEKSF